MIQNYKFALTIKSWISIYKSCFGFTPELIPVKCERCDLTSTILLYEFLDQENYEIPLLYNSPGIGDVGLCQKHFDEIIMKRDEQETSILKYRNICN